MSDYEVKVESAKPENTDPEWLRLVEKIADWLDARLGIRFWTLTGLVVGGRQVEKHQKKKKKKKRRQGGPHPTPINRK